MPAAPFIPTAISAQERWLDNLSAEFQSETLPRRQYLLHSLNRHTVKNTKPEGQNDRWIDFRASAKGTPSCVE
jgi:hypothetical protein